MPGQKSSIVCDSSGNHGVLTIGGVGAQAMPGQKSSIVCDSSGNHGVLTIGGVHRQCQARNNLSCATRLETMEFSQ
ncbi:hypothetical protein RRG08_062626 [Elysia crispata]|uniref:Uncharacterized protein n=1 Tax=Elysia crispata TaxID=231223 RepID=A0AAE1D6R3_9GAST|nr:hypothetical protein RRG08_062626 [Elysia crispata]